MDELRVRWADAGQRADITHQLAERGSDFATVFAQAGQPESDALSRIPTGFHPSAQG